MALFLLSILVIIEIGFSVMEMTAKCSKKEWARNRLIADAGEIAVFLLMTFLPGIDGSFRFTGLIVLLVIRVIFAGIFFLIDRKNNNTKKPAAIITGAVLSVVLIAASLVPAFVFADYTGRPVTGPFTVRESEAILVDRARTEAFESDGSPREVPAHFYFPAEAAGKENKSLPLVIFSHGAFGYYQSNTSTYMELASNGYVVVSLDHPYHAFFTKDTVGKTIIVDRDFLQTAFDIGKSDMSEAEVYDITSKWMELREGDMNFVIDTIKEAADTGNMDDSWFIPQENSGDVKEAVSLIDTDKIGLMGHSLGGATAVTVGRREDIGAVIDLDGTMLGEEIGTENGKIIINETPYDTPILAIDSESHHESRLAAEKAGEVYSNNTVLNNATEGYSTYFKGAAHMDFTDLPLFSPFLAGMLGKGEVDSVTCIDQMNQIVLSFFNCYLKGEGSFTVNESY